MTQSVTISRPGFNETDEEILEKIKELQLFVAGRLKDVSDISMGQNLINDIQTLHYIWRKDKNSI